MDIKVANAIGELEEIKKMEKAARSKSWKLVKEAIDNRDIVWLKEYKDVITEEFKMDNKILATLIRDTRDHKFILECLLFENIIEIQNSEKKYIEIASELIEAFKSEKELQEFIEGRISDEEEKQKIYIYVYELSKKHFPELLKKYFEFVKQYKDLTGIFSSDSIDIGGHEISIYEQLDFFKDLMRDDINLAVEYLCEAIKQYYGIEVSEDGEKSSRIKQIIEMDVDKTVKIKDDIFFKLLMYNSNKEERNELIKRIIKEILKNSFDSKYKKYSTCFWYKYGVDLVLLTEDLEYIKEMIDPLKKAKGIERLIIATKDEAYIKEKIETYIQDEEVSPIQDTVIIKLICSLTNTEDIKAYLDKPITPMYDSDEFGNIGDIIVAINNPEFIRDLDNETLLRYIKKMREKRTCKVTEQKNEEIEIKKAISARLKIGEYLYNKKLQEGEDIQPIIDKNLEQLRMLYEKKYENILEAQDYVEILRKNDIKELYNCVNRIQDERAEKIYKEVQKDKETCYYPDFDLRDMIDLLKAYNFSCKDGDRDFYCDRYEELLRRKKIEEMIGADPELTIGEECVYTVKPYDIVTAGRLINRDIIRVQNGPNISYM